MTAPAARVVLLLLSLWLGCGQAAHAGPLSDWAVVVVAGDWRAHGGGKTEAFDNARRDVSTALIAAGFDAANIRQFSARPKRYPDDRPGHADVDAIYEGLAKTAETAKGGCLFYISSHGAPQGAVLDDRVLLPDVLGEMLTEACPARPVVAIVSACFAGVFVPDLAGPDRMVLTAARRDRTSFGCGQSDKYPYFDDCFLQSLPQSGDFAILGKTVQACVAAREKVEGAEPPSEPQLYIGGVLRPLLPLYSFNR